MIELYEKSYVVPRKQSDSRIGLIQHLGSNSKPAAGYGIRFVITNIDDDGCHCELGAIINPYEIKFKVFPDGWPGYHLEDIFWSIRRKYEDASSFNAVLVIPTGIGCELGGHAGDGGAVARLVAQSCDTLITHPNVVNASDIQELPENGLYVEGSVLTRLMMGTISLQKVRSNRVLVVIDKHEDKYFHDAAVNAVNGARAAMGLNCPEIVVMENPIDISVTYSKSGRAVGSIKHLERLFDILHERRDTYDAIALSTAIKLPDDRQERYFFGEGGINPWGGAEAMLTHAVSSMFDVPSAHSPMMISRDVINANWGTIDPRKSAEAVSITYLHCVLRGLHNAPRFNLGNDGLSVHNVSCLIIPDGCVGLPTLAAIEQGIPVIAVKNKNIMQNDLKKLPFEDGKLFQVDNYLEAVGVMNALRAGVSVETVGRPLSSSKVTFQ